ncbi:MAG TPA: tryptophan transporter [Methanocellaceae archaeon]
MKSKDIVIVGILLGIGAIVRYVSLIAPGPITSNLVIAFYSLAIVLVAPRVKEALGIGIVAGIICALISHSLFPPANLISEPIGALVAIFAIIGVNKLVGTKERKDNAIGFVITGIGLIAMLAFTLFFALDQYKVLAFPLLTTANTKIAFGAISVLVALVGLYFIPNTLAKFKAAIVALLATLASGISFIVVAALVIFAVPGILFTTKAPPVDVFVLSALPIVIGCAIINMILAQILYFPAKKAMR